MVLTINVRLTNGTKFTVEAPSQSITVAELKGLCVAGADCPVERQRLVHRGRILADDKSLEEYGTWPGAAPRPCAR